MKALMVIMVTYYPGLSVSTQQFESLGLCNSMKPAVSNAVNPPKRNQGFWTTSPGPKVELVCIEIK